MKNFGDTIRELREQRGLLLREVAAAVEIDTALLSKLERSERRAHRVQVLKIARCFGVSEDVLVLVWLSDKILELLAGEPLGYQVLKTTVKRINKI
ncbi:MAG: XRE family transcriptional regulator [Flavobacterium sp.]|nr:MAG: XRE family transcriptional regulator [Flavobacterium sp.]